MQKSKPVFSEIDAQFRKTSTYEVQSNNESENHNASKFIVHFGSLIALDVICKHDFTESYIELSTSLTNLIDITLYKQV